VLAASTCTVTDTFLGTGVGGALNQVTGGLVETVGRKALDPVVESVQTFIDDVARAGGIDSFRVNQEIAAINRIAYPPERAQLPAGILPVSGGSDAPTGYGQLASKMTSNEPTPATVRAFNQMGPIYENLIREQFKNDSLTREAVLASFRNGDVDTVYKVARDFVEQTQRDPELVRRFISGSEYRGLSPSGEESLKYLNETLRGQNSYILNSFNRTLSSQGVDFPAWSSRVTQQSWDSLLADENRVKLVDSASQPGVGCKIGLKDDVVNLAQVDQYVLGISSNPCKLSMDEINSIRTEEKVGNYTRKIYTGPEGVVSTMFIIPNFDKIPPKEADEILAFLRARQIGEGYRYEPLIVNSLLEQFQIGQKWGLSNDSLYVNFKLIVDEKGFIVLDGDANLYLRVLDDHIKVLRQQGVSEEELVTEFAGHIFHESVHNGEGNMRAVLLNGKSPIGEITTVTAQMAFYLDEGYTGYTAYTPSRFRAGLNKIQNGITDGRDYDIATYVGGSLILKSLKEAYPVYVGGLENMDAITASRAIIARLSVDERQTLVPTLKKAIVDSADENVFDDILNRTKR